MRSFSSLLSLLSFLKRKHCPCKPGSVPLAGRLSFIYSAGCPTAQAFYPPSGPERHRTDSPLPMVYANLQPPDGTARRSPAGWWSLTPPSHPYSCPTDGASAGAVVLFSHIQLSPTAGIFTSGASCAARTFLSCLLAGTSGRPWHCFPSAKVRISGENAKFFSFYMRNS